jgi:4-amino-4-deoxy-L-arabinose transferase-like glycosyltransferase
VTHDSVPAMKPHTRLASAAAAVAVMAVLAIAATRVDPLGDGLSASFFTTLDWKAPSARTVVGMPSTDEIARAWRGSAPEAFSVEWSGAMIVLRDDAYTFETSSDDGSWVYVDGERVVDNGGHHASTPASGTVRLRRGVHTIVVRYFQDGGPFGLEVRLARAGEPLAPVPAWMLAPRRVSFQRFFAAAILRRLVPLLAVAAAGAAAIAFAALGWAWLVALGATAVSDRVRVALTAVLVGSFLLNVWSIWWGLPGYSWAGDELTPPAVFNALENWFARGWFDRWPPLHFYMLSAAYVPVLLVEWIGGFTLPGPARYTAFVFISRLVSLAAASATVAIVYQCGAHAFSRRAGLFSALALSLLVPFVYYAKTANVDVPLTFWVAWSLLFLLRVLDTLALRDYLWFAVSAALAVCTKDQAYAVYLAAPFLIVHAEWRRNRGDGRPRPLVRAAVNRRLLWAAATAAAVFAACHNLLFNFAGFVRHVKYITGAGSEGYRLFEASLSGRLELLARTVRLDAISFGWPLSVLSVAGFVLAVRDRRARPIAWAFSAIVVSYYAGFINVILYNYDRFLFPVFLIQALFAGFACDRLMSASPDRRWPSLALAGVFAYSVVYASTVDILMARDSRYSVERWLRTHVGPGAVVATMFGLQYLPRLDGLPWLEVRTIEDLKEGRPAFYVLNADYAHALAPDSEPGQLVAALQAERLGYRLAYKYRAANPWPWLPGGHPDLVGPRLELPVFTFFRNINPLIEVYQRNVKPGP